MKRERSMALRRIGAFLSLAVGLLVSLAAPALAETCNTNSPNCIVPGDYEFTTTHDGYAWRYLVHVPASYDGKTAVPLLLDLHGDNGTAEETRGGSALYGGTGQLQESDARGFIAVWPQAHEPDGKGQGGFWNGNGCCYPTPGFPGDIDSVGFLRKVISEMKARANINADRVFIVGNSAGASMTHRMACDAPDAARAFVMVSQVLNKPELCHPGKGSNIHIVHGLLDWLVPYVGNPVLGFRSAPDGFESWRQINGCTGQATRTPVTLVSYTDTFITCRDGTRLSLTTVATGAHTAQTNLENIVLSKLIWDTLLKRYN